MRVNQAQRTHAGRADRARRSTGSAGGGFEVARGGAARRAASPPGVAAVGGVQAILALQGVDDATDRRRRAVRQGSRILDNLEELKIALLSGRIAPAKLAALRNLVEELDSADADPELSDTLRQIDLRARVELAKLSKPAA